MSVNPEYPWLELYLQEPNAPEPFKCEWRRIREDLDAAEARYADLLERYESLREALVNLPLGAHGVYEGANRYDTDDKHVLHLWGNGVSHDLEVLK